MPVPAPIQLERLHSYGARGLGSDPLMTSFRVTGALDEARLRAAATAVAARHDALRTRFACAGPLTELTGGPADLDTVGVTVVPAEESVAVTALDVAPADADAAVEAFAAAPFDLAGGPRVRILLLRTGAEESLVSVVVDHVVVDRIALDLLVAELSDAYAGADLAARPPAGSYLRYAQAQWDLLDGPAGARRLAFWADRFARGGALPPAGLGAGDPAAAGQASAVQRVLDPAVTARIPERARAERTTAFNVVAAALLAGVAARQGGEVVGVATSVSNRTEAASRDLVGLVAVALPLWVDVAHDGFAAMLRRTTRAMAATMANGVALLTAYDAYLRTAPAGAADRTAALNQPTLEMYFDAPRAGGGAAPAFGGLPMRPYEPPRALELSAGGACYLGLVTPAAAALAVLYADEEYGRAAVAVLDGAVSAVTEWVGAVGRG